MNKSFDQFVCLAGMPRAGATLLSAILSQNPSIHTEGHSPMCQMMWDTYLSYQDKCSREFASSGKDHRLPRIIGQIPHVYYQPTDASGNDLNDLVTTTVADVSGNPDQRNPDQRNPGQRDEVLQQLTTTVADVSGNPDQFGQRIVVDRCRSWTNMCNLNMLRSAVEPNPKVIVMVRPLTEIVESYARLFSNNNMESALDQILPQFLNPGTEPVVRAWEGVNWTREFIKQTPEDTTFVFVTYDELVSDTVNTLDRIYQHCGWTPFTHDLTNIVMKNPENETINGLVGQFVVRPVIERIAHKQIVLPENVMEIIRNMEKSVDVVADISNTVMDISNVDVSNEVVEIERVMVNM